MKKTVEQKANNLIYLNGREIVFALKLQDKYYNPEGLRELREEAKNNIHLSLCVTNEDTNIQQRIWRLSIRIANRAWSKLVADNIAENADSWHEYVCNYPNSCEDWMYEYKDRIKDKIMDMFEDLYIKYQE